MGSPRIVGTERRRAVDGLLPFALAVLMSIGGCARPGTAPPLAEGTESPSASASPSSTSAESPSPTPTQSADGPWLAYVDAEHGFGVDYPPAFTYEKLPPLKSWKGNLGGVRFFDRRFADMYPDGQIEIRLFSKDDENLRDWVDKHSAPSARGARDDDLVYFRDTTNIRATTAAGRDAVSFDWRADEAGTVRSIAFFFGDSVVVADWYANPNYEAELQPIFERLLWSWRETEKR